jgi:hypothetical protein
MFLIIVLHIFRVAFKYFITFATHNIILLLEGGLEQQAKEFLVKTMENHQWAEGALIGFISYELERVKERDIRMHYS